jgi:hypothetical protein
MDIVKSSLWREVEQILVGGEKPVHFIWQVTIFAGEDIVKPLRVRSIDVDQDFLNNYADFVLLDVVIPLGTYAKRIYPNIGKLEVELRKIRIGEVSSGAKQDDPTQVERYTATMIDTGNPIIEASTGNVTSEEDLNRLEILNVQFQLTNKLLEQVRMIPVGGIYRNMTGEQVVKAVLTKGSQLAKVDDTRKLQGVEMVKASNQAVREQVVIPPTVQLVDICHHIHYHCGGLYAAGLGYYLHRDHWYVFPAFDVKRFNTGVPTLTIINVPANKLPGVERTYRKDGDNLVVVATGNSVFRDLKNAAQLAAGNGVRFADANQVMDKFVTTQGNKTVAARARQNTEMISDKRENDLNYVTAGRRAITANPFVEFSALAARQGSGASFVWENADRSLVYPGMPVRIMYLEGAEIKELYGVLHGAHEYASLREQGGTANRFSSSVTLSVFARPQNE